MVEDKKKKRPLEEPSDQDRPIILKIKSQDGIILCFTVKPNSVMKKVFQKYCEKKQILDYKTVRFIHNGNRLSSRKTVKELGLEDDDQIDAMLEQDGGGHTPCF